MAARPRQAAWAAFRARSPGRHHRRRSSAPHTPGMACAQRASPHITPIARRQECLRRAGGPPSPPADRRTERPQPWRAAPRGRLAVALPPAPVVSSCVLCRCLTLSALLLSQTRHSFLLPHRSRGCVRSLARVCAHPLLLQLGHQLAQPLLARVHRLHPLSVCGLRRLRRLFSLAEGPLHQRQKRHGVERLRHQLAGPGVEGLLPTAG